MNKNARPAWLLLADGSVMQGKSFGCTGTTMGEVVFTTAMTGYQETLTDPNYYGQIVAQTFPLIGNYGINPADRVSDRVVARGHIVREYCEIPSNFRCEGTIEQFLLDNGIIALYDIDTRALTRKLREQGVMNGVITTEPIDEARREALLAELAACTISGAVEAVSVKEPKVLAADEEKARVAVLDFGCKTTTAEALRSRGCSITLLPYNTPAAELAGFDGILLSDGPGDPREYTAAVENIKAVLALGLPVFGIGLGHQLVALANGGKVEKLKYGHRGANQPVRDLERNRVFVTTQNHGYVVAEESLPQNSHVTHKNANDGSCEGLAYEGMPVFTVQFDVNGSGYAHDTGYLFDRFVEMMQGRK